MPSPQFESRNPDYPPELEAEEQAAVRQRRTRIHADPDAPTVGFALSGGGIRSATFCLGLFQALARERLIRRIDFLSTVSGGGYFGSFLGTAFMRENSDVESVERELADNHSWSVCWLRENGRFLSPNGSGDNWLTAAVALRNWAALHLVILTFAFLVIGLGVLVRVDLSTAATTLSWWKPVETFFWGRPLFNLWWSPWLVLPTIPFCLLMLPTGLIYWGTQITPLMAVLRCCLGLLVPDARTMTNAEFISRTQNVLTRGFMVGLATTFVLLVYALVDSVGQTIYLRWAANDFAFPSLWTALTGAGFAAYGFASRLVVYLERFLGTKRIRITFDVVALVLALLWLSLIVVGLSVLACGIAWRWDVVWNTREYQLMSGGWPLMVAVTVCFVLSWIFSRSFGFVNLSSMQQMYAARLSRAYLGATNPNRRQHANHNMTDLIPGDEVPLDTYAPHGNGGPLHLINVTVNETISGRTQIERRDRKGLPMAIGPCGISVGTDAHALWAPADSASAKPSILHALWEERKREIVPIPPPRDDSRHALQSQPPFARGAATAPPTPHHASPHPRIEALSLGRWISISGAAFTTGTGANTTLGLSLLLGLANIRLGYWWDSGIPPRKRPGRVRANFLELASRVVSWLLPVQSCLMNEFFARFHGPARRHWYLSDGGHFENTACYELIRRRVPLIICSDAGQDPHYQFADLANLVRKARTDFGAEIQIVRRGGEGAKDDPGVAFPMPTLEQLLHTELLDVIGSPEDFFPLSAADSDDNDNASARAAPPPPNARRHALLARIHYLDNDTFSWLLLIKPSLMGDEAIDVVEYQRTHPLFPQEPTSDQYFDEAQWESYRKLGEHIGIELFTPPAGPSGKVGAVWSPSQMRPPKAPPPASLERVELGALVSRLS